MGYECGEMSLGSPQELRLSGPGGLGRGFVTHRGHQSAGLSRAARGSDIFPAPFPYLLCFGFNLSVGERFQKDSWADSQELRERIQSSSSDST